MITYSGERVVSIKLTEFVLVSHVNGFATDQTNTEKKQIVNSASHTVSPSWE